MDQVPANGPAIHYAYSANYDGTDVPVVGSPNGDTAARTRMDATTTMNIVAPQLSFNFGSSDGWSYLSLGAGTARVDAEVTGSSSAINAGGGARWFIKRHLGVGFDLRLHRIAADGDVMGDSMIFAASVGFSVK